MNKGLSVRDAEVAIAGRPLLRAIDFDAFPGEVLAIVGPNGVGKTTLLRAIAGLFPARGTVLLDGATLAATAPRERARRVALVTADEALLDGMTVREAVAAGRYAHHPWWDWHESPDDEAAIERALHLVELDARAAQRLDSLSSGERQRAWIALALAQESRLMLLDEPTSHLDLRYAIETLALLRRVAREDRIVVAVLHAIEEAAEFADRVLVLGEGTALAFGPPASALDPAILERAYGIRLETVRADGTTFFRRMPPEG